MIKVGVGISKADDSFKAGNEAAKEAVDKLDGAKSTFAIVFSSVKYNLKQLLDGVRSVSAVNTGNLIGCSDAGEITDEGVYNEAVAVMCIASDKIKITTGIGKNLSENARRAGRDAALQSIKPYGSRLPMTSQIFIKSKSQEGKFTFLTPYAMIALPDALSGGGNDAVRGITDVVGLNFPVVGGSPGDDLQFKKTSEYLNGRVFSDAVAVALIKSELSMGFGVAHGWKPVGKAMVVTKVKGGRVYKIDNKPAIEAYEKFFSKRITHKELGREFVTHSLGVPAWEGEYRLRWPIFMHDDKSITCAADIKEGSVVRIMAGTTRDTVKAGRLSAMEAMLRAGDPEEVAACILFDCVSRKAEMKKHAWKEIKAIKDVVGKETPIIGFYTYGEISPTFNSPTGYHNQTTVSFIISKTTQGELFSRKL